MSQININTIIYSLRNRKKKYIILLENYIELQHFILDNTNNVGMLYIYKDDNVLKNVYDKNQNIIFFDFHERLATDITKLKNYDSSNTIIVISHPLIEDTVIYDKTKNFIFDTIYKNE